MTPAVARRQLSAPGWMLFALAGGLLGGMAHSHLPAGSIDTMRFVGGLWLDALRATIIPLVFALVTTGVASLSLNRTDASASRLGQRLITTFVGFLVMSVILAALLVPLLLDIFSISSDAGALLRIAAQPNVLPPTAADAIRALIPVNIVASAASGAIVPVVMFAAILGLALGRIDRKPADALLLPLRGLADAMIVVIGWVLAFAMIGIFALAFVIGATLGVGALRILGGYVAIQAIMATLLLVLACALACLLARVSPWSFAKAAAPAQAVAAGTQSSIAALPAMLESVRRLGVADKDAGIILPLAVAVFKVTAPASSLIVAFTLAHVAGVPVTLPNVLIAIPLSLTATFAVLGMPGSVSFLAANTPAALALGAPVEFIPILLAVDTIPDMFRTTANVTTHMASAVIVAPPGMALSSP